jgi:hypothetical protein
MTKGVRPTWLVLKSLTMATHGYPKMDAVSGAQCG